MQPESGATASFIAVVEAMPDSIAILDLDGTVRHVNTRMRMNTGLTTESTRGRNCFEFVHPDDLARVIPAFHARLRGEEMAPLEHRLATASGDWVRVEGTIAAAADAGVILACFRMMTRLDEKDERVRYEHEFLGTLVREVQVGIVACDGEGRVVSSNEAIAADHPAPVRGQPIGQWLDSLRFVEANGCTPMPTAESPLARAFSGTRIKDAECSVLANDEQLHHWRVNGSALEDGTGKVIGSFVAIQDVTQQRRAEEALQRRATQDSLTGLLNRGSLIEALRERLAACSAADPVGVFFIDVDGFKSVNDVMGHSAGDALLAAIGEVLRAAAGPYDSIGRMGGDEFVVVSPGVASIEDSEGIRTMLRDLLQTPMILDGERYDPRVSIGAAVCQDPDETPERLLRAADFAMYREKRRRVAPRPAEAA